MSLPIRALAPADAVAARRLGWEAFGVPPGQSLNDATISEPGRHWFGAFDADLLVATAVDRELDSWFGGRPVPTCGVASVTVAAEHRGARVLGPLLRTVLASARERGAVVATLFPSAPRIYRGFGFEVITKLRWVRVPSADLRSLPTGGTRLRRATVADVESVRQVYDRWAAAQNGPLSRRGVSFPASDHQRLDASTGITLAGDESGAVRGYAAWTRGAEDARNPLDVTDLVALDLGAHRDLLRTVGSFGSVADTVRLRTSGSDPIRTLLPSTAWTTTDEDLYMLALLDVAAALSGTSCTRGLSAELTFTLVGGALDDLDGGYRLTAAGGTSTCVREPASVENRTLDARGLALLYAGAATCSDLRALGLLDGGELDDDLTWDALFCGRGVHVRDTF